MLNIYINGTKLITPESFALTRNDIYAGEYTTMTGSLIADRVGWKYADLNLKWNILPDSMVQALVSMGASNTFKVEYPDGTIVEEPVRRASVVALRNRNTINGEVYWRDVSVSITFLEAHGNE